jgi:hypothetical protein
MRPSPQTHRCVKSAAFSVKLVRRFQGCDEWKTQPPIDLLEDADGLAMHAFRFKEMEFSGHPIPPEARRDLAG